jgi:DNA-binding beta-propeller fold protein YncE
MDRRTFMKLSVGSAAVAMLPLSGLSACTTEGASSSTEVELTAGPIAVGKRGVRFEVQPDRHRLVITQIDGTQSIVGRVGSGVGELNYPMRVATNDGLAYVVECGNHRVQVFDADGNSVGMLGQDELSYPKGIAIAGDQAFVADARNKRVVVFDLTGPNAGVATQTFGANVLQAPYGIAVVDGRVMVADAGLRQVVELSRDGTLVRALEGEFVLPYDVAFDGDTLFVADAAQARLSLFDPRGRATGTLELAKAATFCSLGAGRLFVG